MKCIKNHFKVNPTLLFFQSNSFAFLASSSILDLSTKTKVIRVNSYTLHMPTQSSELERWLFLLLCLRSCQSQSKAEAPNPTAKRCRVKLALEVSGWSRRCQQGRSCLGAAPLVWPRASFVQTQLGSPAGEGSLDNITVTTRRTCLGYFQNAREGKNAAAATKRPACKRVRNSLQVNAWKHGLCTKRPHA